MISQFKKFYAVIARIPKGKVATYGQIAALAGLPRHARQVGYALHASPASLPWHRVINSKGELSLAGIPGVGDKQRALLEREGVEFDGAKVSLARFRWKAGSRKSGVGSRPGPLS